jgi:hypothetical protein
LLAKAVPAEVPDVLGGEVLCLQRAHHHLGRAFDIRQRRADRRHHPCRIARACS